MVLFFVYLNPLGHVFIYDHKSIGQSTWHKEGCCATSKLEWQGQLIGNIPKSLLLLLLGQHSWQVNNWSWNKKGAPWDFNFCTTFSKAFLWHKMLMFWFKFTLKNSTIFLLNQFDKKSAQIRAMVFCLSGNNPSPEAMETQFVPASIIFPLGLPVCWHWFICSHCCGRAHLGHCGSVFSQRNTSYPARGFNPCLITLLLNGIVCPYVGKNWKMNERTLKHCNCYFTHTHTLCILSVITNMLGRSNYH